MPVSWAAQHLGITEAQVRDGIHCGQMNALELGGRFGFTPEEIAEWDERFDKEVEIVRYRALPGTKAPK